MHPVVLKDIVLSLSFSETTKDSLAEYIGLF